MTIVPRSDREPDFPRLRVIRPGLPPQEHPSADDRRRQILDRRRRRAETWTLRSFFNEFAVPRYFHAADGEQRADRTLADYRSTLSLWEVFSGDPFIINLSRDHTRRFRIGLNGLPLTDRTKAKHVGNLNFLLKLIGWPANEELPGAKLRRKLPEVRRVHYQYTPPRDGFTLDEMAALLEAARQATGAPLSGIPPNRYWPALGLFAHNTALRKETIRGARWDMIDEAGWLHPPASIMKCRKEGFILWLNKHARAAAESIRTSKDGLLFPWPYEDAAFHRHMHRLCEAAGVKPRPAAKKKGLGLHNIRKGTLTLLARENPMVAAIVGAHSGGVTQNHYVDPSIMAPYLDRLPQPGPVIQKRLFE